MNQIAIVDDLTERRRAAARKAVETRRARAHNQTHNPATILAKPPKAIAAQALAAFDREAASEMPDWHRVALELRRALTERPQSLPKKLTRTVALPAPPWPDYQVDHLGSFKVRNPTIVVTFADGEVVRAPAVSAKDKPVNIGR